MTHNRYYRGRHYLQERNRSTKRINLSSLQPHQHSHTGGMGLKPHSSSSTLLLPPTTPLLPPGGKPGAAAAAGGLGAIQQQQQQQQGGSRRLAIPAPAFIPLEAPQELLQQQQEGGAPGDAGSWRQQQGARQGKQRAINPTELVQQVGASHMLKWKLYCTCNTQCTASCFASGVSGLSRWVHAKCPTGWCTPLAACDVTAEKQLCSSPPTWQ
jgi:hypothetical protein